MVNKLTILFLVFILAGAIQAQRTKIVIQSVSPNELTSQGTSLKSVSTGLYVNPIGTIVYISPKNISDANPILTAAFTLTAKPNGSVAALGPWGTNGWDTLKLDMKGTYTISLHITTVKGSADTTVNIVGATYVGVPAFDGVTNTSSPLTCATCHSSSPRFSPILTAWSTSGHANGFKNYMDDPTQTHFGPSCFNCHTTGADKSLVANNNGFDDVAKQLGWTWTGPSIKGKWDTLKTQFPGLVPWAVVGCEACHGPASEHTSTGDKTKIQINIAAGVCLSCHDAPPHHTKGDEYKNSLHFTALWSSSFAQTAASQNNNLGNCVRCHDGTGFVNFTKGKTTNTTGWIEADHNFITCATCHDPHGNGLTANLRQTPAGSDTLANGFSYTGKGGTGMLCMNCHKARGNGDVAVKANVSSRFGPHHSPQADVFFGKNAISFDGNAYASGVHNLLISNACVDCHMAATDTSAANIDKVGGHSFKMTNAATGFDNVKFCVTCHSGVTSFDSFKSDKDYDQNGKIGTVQEEVAGLIEILKVALPHTGVDTVNYLGIAASKDSVILKKAWWNLQMIDNDLSGGMHNFKFAVDVLVKSIKAVNPALLSAVKDAPGAAARSYKLDQNYPNPFNPTTRISFTVPASGNVKIRIYDVMGNFVKEVFNQNVQAGSFSASWAADDAFGNKVASGIYFYKLEAANFTMAKKMVLMK